MWETSNRVKNDMHFVGNEKRDIRGKRETRSLARKEKRDISHEKWDISRNVWHFTRNLVVDIEKVRQFQLYVIKKHFFFLRRSSGFLWHTRTLFYLKSLKKKKNLLNRNVRPLWVRPLKHEANSRRFLVKCQSRPISMSWGHNPPLMLVFHHLLLSVWLHISWYQERIPPLRQQRLLRAEGWRLTR